MRNLKKVLVMVLALAMMLSIMVTGAGAITFTDAKDIDSKHQEAVDMSIALHIIEGYPDGSFQPNGNVTRAEMAKIICIALNGGEVPATSVKPTPTFADIDNHWAEGFIEYCYAKGVVAGKNDTTFDPSGNVTGSEAAKMLLVALGYNADVEKYVGSEWELYVNVQANQDGLYKDLLDIETAEPLSREHAAQMIWNALQSGIVDKHSQIDRNDGSITDIYAKSNTEMLEKMYNGEIATGQMIGFSYSSKDKDWDYKIALTSSIVKDGETVRNSGDVVTINSATDYTALIGQKVKGVFDYDKSKSTFNAYGIFAFESQVVISGLVADLPNLKPDDKDFTFGGEKIKLEGSVASTPVREFSAGFNRAFVYNDIDASGNETPNYSNSNLNYLAGKFGTDNVKDFDSMNFYAVDYDGNGKVDFIVVQPVIIAKVGYVNNSDINLKSVFFDPCNYRGEVSKSKDDVSYYDGIAKNDYVAITPAAATANDTDQFVKLDKVSGKINTKDGVKVTIDGNTYKLDVTYGDVPVGTTLKDAALYNNFIFDADKSGYFDITDYVVVMKGEDGTYGSTAKLLFSDGSKKVIDLNTDNNKWSSLNPGTLYTYETNKDQEYTLTPATVTGTGFDLAAMGTANVTVQKASSSSNKVGYINGFTVANDAVIFIRDNDGGYKVISGSRLKTMDYTQFANKGQYVLGTEDSAQGKGVVNMAYLWTTQDKVKTDDSLYGYITGVVEAKNDNNQDIYIVTLFTKDGEQTLNTVAKGSLNGTAKTTLADGSNYAIAYTLDEDGAIDEISDAAKGELATMKAITGKDTKALWVNDVRTELDDNIVYLTADISEEAGVEAGTIDSVEIADKDNFDNYINNAIVLYNSDGDIACVVYDVNNGTDL